MRFSIVVLLAALASFATASFVSRQDGIPGCALQCVQSAMSQDSCGADEACLCRSDKFVQSSTSCVSSTCQGDDVQTSLDIAQQLCASLGVTLTLLPTSSGAAATDSPAATFGAASASGSPSAADTSNAASPNGVSAVSGILALAGLAVFGL
ncbi:hypothetical protein AN958_07355 [Leucoagaricus sp. SymC.cos]|nr:hypothetical protein AN958_07355 [Leucoagaricus sp. SymC.cos]